MLVNGDGMYKTLVRFQTGKTMVRLLLQKQSDLGPMVRLLLQKQSDLGLCCLHKPFCQATGA